MVNTPHENGEPGNGKKGCERWNEYCNTVPQYWKKMLEDWNGGDSWIKWKLFNGMRETENVNLQKRNSCVGGVNM